MESISEKKLHHQSSTLRKFDLHYLKTITKNFSEDQILGRGGYGIVYKGEQDNGELVAVKKLIMSRAGMDDKQFMNEVRHAMDICHPNIVKLEGYCYQTEKELTFHNGGYIFADEVYRLLCFEYLPNGSLDKYISDESSGLYWHTRYMIIVGICTGLYTLHEGREGASILHLDLKPTNILLDKHMTPKIADFGLSRLFAEGKTHTCTTNIIGSRGYMAPEYIDSSVLSKESDIFSLGVMILEIVAGHRIYPNGTNMEELIEVYKKWRTRLQKSSEKTSLEQCRQVYRCIQLGLHCMEKDPKTRPSITEIVAILKTIEWSVRKDGSDGEEQSGKLVWLDILVSGSLEQSIEALEYICVDMDQWYMPEYIIEDVDRLVSGLTVMVRKTFSSNTVGSSSRHRKYTLNIIMQVIQIHHLVCSVKKGTLEELVTEMLMWLSAEEVAKMDDGSQLLNSLDVAVFKILEENVDINSLLVILSSLLRPLDPSRCSACTPLELLLVKNNKFSELVRKYLHSVKQKGEQDFKYTISDYLDLDLILQSIHVVIEPLGEEEVEKRLQNDDVLVQVVLLTMYGLVKAVGSKIKGHLSMVPIDAGPRPYILRLIDAMLELLAVAATPSVPPTSQTSRCCIQ